MSKRTISTDEDMDKLAKDLKASSDSVVREIEKLSRAMRALRSSKLKDETIVLLISVHAKLGKRTVERLLDALDTLEEAYLKPTKK